MIITTFPPDRPTARPPYGDCRTPGWLKAASLEPSLVQTGHRCRHRCPRFWY